MITNFELIGSWQDNSPLRGYTNKDIGILKSDKGVAKIKRLFSKSQGDFNLKFIRKPGASRWIEYGVATEEFIHKELDKDYEPNEEAINVLFTNNRGTNRIPMTAWTIAHRISHAARRSPAFEYFGQTFSRSMREISVLYGYKIGDLYSPRYPIWDNSNKWVAYAVGTMRSIRTRQLVNLYEFAHELFAQKLITGKITFKPLERRVITNYKMAWGNPSHRYAILKVDMAEANEKMEEINNNLSNAIDYGIDCLFGETLVM